VLQTKISFRLADSKESRKLFFNTDATKLLGNGDMLFYFNQDEIFRLQAPIAITK
jgi:DNA segregation ATPase FtsK/SpoIIIE-like protein